MHPEKAPATPIIRPTRPEDVMEAERVLADGKAALAALGVPQWRGEYPDRVDIEGDIAQGISHVALDSDGRVLAIMALSFDGDESYDAIEGSWLTPSDTSDPRYAVIHRCATRASAAHRGIMTQMFLEAERIAREHGAASIRIDTHERNMHLRGLAQKLGYHRCGVIVLPYPNEIDPLRIAYEKILE